MLAMESREAQVERSSVCVRHHREEPADSYTRALHSSATASVVTVLRSMDPFKPSSSPHADGC